MLKKPSDYPQANIRIGSELAEILSPYLARSENAPAPAVREFINFSGAVLTFGKYELNGLFTVAEWSALAECFTGTFFEPSLLRYLHQEWRDADEDGELSEKWSIQGASVFERLKALPASARWALVDVLMRVGVNVDFAALTTAGVAPSEGVEALK